MKHIELIKAEIERLKGQLIRGACSSQVCMETNCKEEAYNEVLAFIDFLLLNEEPIFYEYNGGEKRSTLKWNQLTTEDLVAEGLADAHGFIKNPEFRPAKFSWRAVRDVFIEGVKAGAQWQKEQMMKGAEWADVNHCERTPFGSYVEFAVDVPKPFKYSDKEKVKLIIVKED